MTATGKYLLLIIVLLVLGGVFLYFSFQSQFDTEEDVTGERAQENAGEEIDPSAEAINTDAWATYTNETFDFSIKIPPGWNVVELSDEELFSGVNFYPVGVTADLPITHHSDVANVSVFPEGIPTEGVFGELVDSNVVFNETTSVSNDFTLSDGSRWATFVAFLDAPPSWSESGFVWARVDIENLETECFREGEIVSPEACDPLMGDEIVYHGSVDERERAIQEAMLSTLTFVDDQM
jgi:hypothetical protein